MSEKDKASDKASDKIAEVKPVSEGVAKQVDEGKEDLAQTTKDYYKARREGLRDIHTGALLGDQPQFFDSEKPETAEKGASTAVADKAGDSQRTDSAMTDRPAGDRGPLPEAKGGDGTAADARVPADGPARTEGDGESITERSPEEESAEALTFKSPEEEAAENIEGGPVKDRDGDGRPTKVEYPDGTSAEVAYDKDGKPEEIKFSNGSSMQRGEDGQWSSTEDGKTTKLPLKEVSVGKDGTITQKAAGGVERAIHPDGSQTVSNEKTGTRVESDADGKVTGEKRSDGTDLKFKYDEKGELTRIEDGKGNVAEKGEGDNWKHYDKDGKEKTDDAEPHTKISVDNNGDVVREDTGDGTTTSQKPDGSLTVKKPDGSKISADSDGNITDIHRPAGGDSKFQYNAKGEMTGYTSGDGTHYDRQGDGTWKSDPPGSERKSIQIDGDGNVNQTKADGGKETIHTDGTVHIEYPSGASGEANPDREVTTMTAPSGRKFDTGGDSATTTGNADDSYAKIAEDSLVVQNSMKPGFKPTAEDVAAEAERIKAINPGVTEPIAAGTKIVIVSSDE